jgi:predicted NBD/HSP70 family sugar kinase
MLTGTNLVYTKQYNLRIVHEVIRQFGPISRADIARHTALTGQTISNLVKELLELDLIVEAEQRRQGRGAPSTALAINPEAAFSIGLDFNHHHLTGVLVDLAGKVRQRAHVEIELPTPEQALDLMADAVEVLIKKQRLSMASIWGVGIGVPGPMHHGDNGDDEYVINPTAFPGWHNIPLASWVRERLGLPVFLENNATAAAVGEHWYGAGQQLTTFFYLFFGSGLGGGLVMNGRPYEGYTGNAGEIGYFPATMNGDSTHTGVHFNLPRLYGILRDAGEPVQRPADLDPLLAAGHPALLEWLEVAADYLTGLVLSVEYLIDPEAIFYGGHLTDAMLKGLMERVASALPSRRIGGKVTAPRHLLATAGVDSAALGVATLPIYAYFAPAPQVLLKRSKRPSVGERHVAPRGDARDGLARRRV